METEEKQKKTFLSQIQIINDYLKIETTNTFIEKTTTKVNPEKNKQLKSNITSKKWQVLKDI